MWNRSVKDYTVLERIMDSLAIAIKAIEELER